MNSKYVFLILSIIFFVSGGAFFYLSGRNATFPKNKIIPTPTQMVVSSPTSIPIPTITIKTQSDVEQIKLALVAKHKWNPSEIIVTIRNNDGTYASGGVKEVASEVGGGYFFAAKVGEVWQIVADGNGMISCSALIPYLDYPSFLIPECYDETTGKIKQR